MRYRSFLIAVGGLCLITAGSVHADSDSYTPVPFNVTSAQDFAQQAAAVRAGLQAGGAYALLNARDRYLVTQDIDAMAALIQRRGDLSGMTNVERVRLFDAQEDANRLLTGDPSGWWKCEQTTQTGSHLPRTLCWSSNDS